MNQYKYLNTHGCRQVRNKVCMHMQAHVRSFHLNVCRNISPHKRSTTTNAPVCMTCIFICLYIIFTHIHAKRVHCFCKTLSAQLFLTCLYDFCIALISAFFIHSRPSHFEVNLRIFKTFYYHLLADTLVMLHIYIPSLTHLCYVCMCRSLLLACITISHMQYVFTYIHVCTSILIKVCITVCKVQRESTGKRLGALVRVKGFEFKSPPPFVSFD